MISKTNKLFALLLLASSAIILSSGTDDIQDDNGKAGYTNSPGEQACNSCHNTYALNSGGGSVTLGCTSMMNWSYVPGQTYPMTVTVARAANSLFGFAVEALTSSGQNAGTLVVTNSAKTQIKSATVNNVSRKNVVHQKNAGVGSGSFTFNFDWTAPTTNVGDVTFYFVGNAANGNGGNNNDYIYSGSQVISFATGINENTRAMRLNCSMPLPIIH